MNHININNCKSYATKKNLETATANIDKTLTTAREGLGARKMVMCNDDGRWTAAYFLGGDSRHYMSYIAMQGFKVIS